MNRRQFLSVAGATATLPLVPHSETDTLTRVVRTWRKGAHLAPGFSPALVNQLGLDFVEGTDPVMHAVVIDPHSSGIPQINCRYLHRIPKFQWDAGSYSQVRSLPNFFNEWVVLNEPSITNTPPEVAAQQANTIIEGLVALDPLINNWFDLNFLMMPQYQDNAWRDAFWDNLTPLVISKVNVLGVHIYPFSRDPKEVRVILKSIRNWQNGRGIGRFPLFLHEIGFGAAHVPQDEAAQYVNDFTVEFENAVWLHGVSWYAYNDARTDTYVTLSNPQQDKLKKAGIAWAGL